MKHKTQLYLNEPGRRGEGERGAGDGGDPFLAGPLGESKNGAALNITALVFYPVSTPPCQPRRGAASIFVPGQLVLAASLPSLQRLEERNAGRVRGAGNP